MLPEEWKPVHMLADQVVSDYVRSEIINGENAPEWFDWVGADINKLFPEYKIDQEELDTMIDLFLDDEDDDD